MGTHKAPAVAEERPKFSVWLQFVSELAAETCRLLWVAGPRNRVPSLLGRWSQWPQPNRPQQSGPGRDPSSYPRVRG